MDTMSYEEFERTPLFHMKGLMPRGVYLYTKIKLDKEPLNKVDFFYECLQKKLIPIMVITELVGVNPDGTNPHLLPEIHHELQTRVPDFSDLDRYNRKHGFRCAKDNLDDKT